VDSQTFGANLSMSLLPHLALDSARHIPYIPVSICIARKEGKGGRDPERTVPRQPVF
jgi:hypothetical protein